MTVEERISRLASLDIERVVKQERKGKVEENVKSIIIEELLGCLGWEKIQGDFDFEHNIENKRADIAIMVDLVPKIIVECKDLDEELDKYIDQAFDYAIKKQVKWIILTNGKEIRLYSTFIENVPERKDHLLIEIKIGELERRFSEIERWISKNSIINQQLDFLTEVRKREIRKKVNTRLLNSIFEQYIPLLKDYYSTNIVLQLTREGVSTKILGWLNYKGINFDDQKIWSLIYGKEAAFNIINRILFLRICEDRKFSEIPNRLSRKGIDAWDTIHRHWTYKELLEDTFNEIRHIDYESIYEENVFDIIDISEDLLREVINHFAEINFCNIDSEILREIYQYHISESERKELGQYYTPAYIIRLILNSIDILTPNQTFLPTKELRLLDPACGSGGFLVEAYELLKRRLQTSNWDPDIIHETLLNKHLYGLEVEPFAAQLSSINLLIKDVNHPVNYLFIAQHDTLIAGGTKQTRLQPIRVKKIISKPTIKGEQLYIEKEFPLSGYDVVIGNPPYFLISKQEGKKKTERKFHTTYLPQRTIQAYQELYYSWPHDNRNPNIFYLFIERGVELLKEKGFLGFIIPDILLAGESTTNLREFILKTCKIKRIIIIEGDVFEEGGITNIILILQKCDNRTTRNTNEIEVINTSTHELKANDTKKDYSTFFEKPHLITQGIFSNNPLKVFSVRMNKETVPIFHTIYRKLKNNKFIQLSELVNIQRGIENLRKEDAIDQISSTKNTIRKLIAVDNIEKYQINWTVPTFAHKFVDYDPPCYRHIKFKDDSYYTHEKIVLKRVSNKLIAAFDKKKQDKTQYFYTLDSIQMIWLRPHVKNFDLRVILAILNSDFMNFYYTTLFSYKQLFSRVQKAFLNQLPIPSAIDFKVQSQICDLVEKLEKKYDQTIDRELNQVINSIYFTKKELQEYSVHLKPRYSLKDVPGIGIEKYFKLAQKGILTINDLINCDIDQIAGEIKGFGVKSLSTWIEEAKNLLGEGTGTLYKSHENQV